MNFESDYQTPEDLLSYLSDRFGYNSTQIRVVAEIARESSQPTAWLIAHILKLRLREIFGKKSFVTYIKSIY